MTEQLILDRPDDWHIHLRDDDALPRTVGDAAEQFHRAIVMPNLVPPVTTADMATAYRDRILAARPAGSQFEPLMVLYLTDQTTPEQIQAAKAAGVVACKLYPAGATTNSASGVTDVRRVYPALEAMEREGLRFLVHGEVTDAEIDIFDREKTFLDRTFRHIVADFPGLYTVLEHITTSDSVDFVQSAGARVAATITAHHLLFNRNKMLVGGIRPHYYCLPILKREQHRQALLKAATSGSHKFFLGTDSAPHSQGAKESSCGCAGAYTAPAAIELYATAFDEMGALDKLEAFASLNGPRFYGLSANADTITLERRGCTLPESYPYAQGENIIPLLAGETLNWAVRS